MLLLCSPGSPDAYYAAQDGLRLTALLLPQILGYWVQFPAPT